MNVVDWPAFSDDEIEAVTAVLRSGRVNYWTGPHGKAFERDFSAYCGVRYGVALANGTMALELALRAIGIGPGDDVIVTARSFFASASCIVACGARPVFADVDSDSQNITVDSLDAALTQRTRAVIAVHLAGWPCDMNGILEYCGAKGLGVVEDCAQAHGAALGGRPVGSWGDVAAFSFCNDKIMSTAGEGGMVVTDDESVWQSVWSYKDHGKSMQEVTRSDHPPGFQWLHESFGTNGRMTEVQSVVGRLQLGKLEQWSALRQRHASTFIDILRNEPSLRVPEPPNGVRHAWYRFYCFIKPETLGAGWDRDRVLGVLRDSGIACGSGSCPEIYREKAFEGLDSRPNSRLAVARELGETSLMFLVDPSQSTIRIQQGAELLRTVLARARK